MVDDECHDREGGSGCHTHPGGTIDVERPAQLSVVFRGFENGV